MASLATIPTMFFGRGRPRNAVHRSRSLLQGPHQLPNYLGARKIERRLRSDDDHDRSRKRRRKVKGSFL